MNKFVILSGPAGVGKRPLFNAFRKFYPDWAVKFKRLLLFNNRAPRPEENEGIDYLFRSRAEIEALRDRDGYVVVDVRGDLQALEIAQIQQILADGNIPFYEGNPFVPGKLWEIGMFERFPTVSIFLSPLSKEEIVFLRAPERHVDLNLFVREVQRRKLLHRFARQKEHLSLIDLQNIEKRCSSAYVEMREAWKFNHVIHTHDSGGHDNWDAFYYPIGNARKSLMTFAALVQGESAAGVDDTWTPDLIP